MKVMVKEFIKDMLMIMKLTLLRKRGESKARFAKHAYIQALAVEAHRRNKTLYYDAEEQRYIIK